ncbi:MAG TPA: RcnB family protein [Ramlibacter sp.]|jgi:Ni/Co efflux regulator RcnB
MKSTTLVCTALVAALGFGTVAQAQPEHDWHRGTQGGDHAQHQWQGRAPAQQNWQQHQHQWQGHASSNRGYVQPQYGHERAYDNHARNYAPRNYAYGGYAAPHDRAYGYAPRNYAYAGGYVPYDWRSHRWWAADWRARDLYAPPYGYQWIQTDTGDVLLVALATGLIANAILAGQ